VQPTAGPCDRSQPVAAPELLRIHHLAVEELEHERVPFREPGDERRADPGLRCAARVPRLVLAVDREQTGVLAGDADDEGAPGGDDLEVRVREPAGERLDRGRSGERRDRGQDVVERHAPILYLD